MGNINADGEDIDMFLVKKRTVVLNNEQIKSLPTTPIEIIPSPGEGKLLLILQGFLTFNSFGGVYGNIGFSESGGITSFYVDGCSVLQYSLITQGLFSETEVYAILVPQRYSFQTSDAEVVAGAANVGQSVGSGLTNLPDEAVTIKVQNFTPDYVEDLGNFTGGHSDNYLKITLFYITVDL